ncbi:MAG: hypothetical protein K0S82_738 [Gaiellaceae bacterium]|nr:hypothetical protein [Gaiellaceae bacterium]
MSCSRSRRAPSSITSTSAPRHAPRTTRSRPTKAAPDGEAFGEEEAVTLLDSNLKQEKEALREVEKIATRLSNESVPTATA